MKKKGSLKLRSIQRLLNDRIRDKSDHDPNKTLNDVFRNTRKSDDRAPF